MPSVTQNKGQETIIKLLKTENRKPINQFTLHKSQQNSQSYNLGPNSIIIPANNFPTNTPQINFSGNSSKVPHNTSINSYQYQTFEHPPFNQPTYKES